MYHAIVKRRIMSLFEAINRGDAAPVLAAFARQPDHVMIGHHALSGRRTSKPAITAWYERLFRLLPDVHFEVRRIDIAGPPWATLATVEWVERNSGTDGVVTTNAGIHVISLRWGRMTRLVIMTNTVALGATLHRIAAAGTAEALADPITDAAPWP